MDTARVFAEKRSLILPVAIAALINLAVYAIVIYPRTASASEIERRAQAAEANGIIDARTFSWTLLFDDIEATLPPTVMLTSITPSIGKDGATVRLTVLGRTVEAIDTFIERLEATKRFEGVQVFSEVVTDEGLFETQVTGRYLTGERPPAPSTPVGATTPGRQGAR